MSIANELEEIFDADRRLREAESRLLRARNSSQLVDLLVTETTKALVHDDRDEAVMRLERLADLCAQVHGPQMTDALIAILNDQEPRVRVAAGEALRDVGFERYAEVARGIERVLDSRKTGPAMSELPWVLAEIGEPSALPLIRRFLDHVDPDVTAAAIEALAQLEEPEAIDDLRRFVDDDRVVVIEDLEDDEKTTIGDLARDALTMFGVEAAS